MKVQELLSDESKWAKNAYAVARNGRRVESAHPGAVKWCLLGALDKCYPTHRRWSAAVKKVQKFTPLAALGEWNDADKTTFADIRRVIERADI